TLGSVAAAQLFGASPSLDGLNLSSPASGSAAWKYAPLTPAEQILMNQLLGTSEFQFKAAVADVETQMTNIEHGFFIWLLSDGNFKLSGVYTGEALNMGRQFQIDAMQYTTGGPNLWGSFHAHW